MTIKFIEVKNDSPILDRYHFEREICYICTRTIIWKITGTTTIARCNPVENLYLIISYIFVAFLFFHSIVDFYCNYYCIYI